jgi:hypothetical protein
MGRSTFGHDNATAPRWSRRAMLTGGAAGALGAIGFEALANTPQAQAQASLTGGVFTSGFAPAVVALSQSGGWVAVNASQGNVFTLTLTASGWTIANPTNPTGDGQVIKIRLSQDSTGGRTVSWGGAYNFGSVLGTANTAPALSVSAEGTDILSFEYVAALSQWCYLGAAFPQDYGGLTPPAVISVVQSAYFPYDVQGNFDNNVTEGNSVVMIPALYGNNASGSFSTSNPQFGTTGNSVPGAQLVAGTSPFDDGADIYTAIWLLPDLPGGATFVRLDFTYPDPGGPHGTVAYEIAGLGPAPQLDPAGGMAEATGYGNVVASGACPPITQPVEIVFGFGHIYNPALSAPSSAWTAAIAGPDPDVWTGYQITSTTGGTYSWTQTANGTASWGAGVAAICPQPPSSSSRMPSASVPARRGRGTRRLRGPGR